MTEKLVFISCQPSNFEYTWQIDVQCWNFRELNILQNYQIIVWYKNEVELKNWVALQQKYKEAKFFFYKDQGAQTNIYVPVIRPHTLKRHFKEHEEYLKDKVFFYLDNDVIFRELPDFENFIHDDICWQSDTSGYLDYNYVVRKEEEGKVPDNQFVKKLCEIGGVSVETYKSYAGKTGGAQYILKGIDSDFWAEVEQMSLDIYSAFLHKSNGGTDYSMNSLYFNSENNGLQSWCADMWAVNFCLWKRGKFTDVHPEFRFSWATDQASIWHECKIYHNAGGMKKGMFNKNAEIWKRISPVGKNFSVLSAYANKYYVDAIKKVR